MNTDQRKLEIYEEYLARIAACKDNPDPCGYLSGLAKTALKAKNIQNDIKKPDAYVATIRRAQQISSDRWDIWEESLVCHELTTMEDLHVWVKRRTQYSGNYATQVTISFAEVKRG
jgi:hypothetical protein